MSMYPSLEDMKADQMIQAQFDVAARFSANSSTTINQQPIYPFADSLSVPPYPVNVSSRLIPNDQLHLYPALTDLHDYMGLNLTSAELDLIANSHNAVAVSSPRDVMATSSYSASMVAPLSGHSIGLKRAAVTHGLREVTLCKSQDGKVGLRVKALNKGVFVALVHANSPAALAGLRFGDQILQINDENVAGYSMEKVHDLIKKASDNGIRLVVRDRPFERTITLHKDSTGYAGFAYKNGKITHIVKDSSAARNGLLIDHQLLEINGQNVVGLDDKAIRSLIETSEPVLTLTIMPSMIFDHMVKSMASGLIKKLMDHSIPDF